MWRSRSHLSRRFGPSLWLLTRCLSQGFDNLCTNSRSSSGYLFVLGTKLKRTRQPYPSHIPLRKQCPFYSSFYLIQSWSEPTKHLSQYHFKATITSLLHHLNKIGYHFVIKVHLHNTTSTFDIDIRYRIDRFHVKCRCRMSMSRSGDVLSTSTVHI